MPRGGGGNPHLPALNDEPHLSVIIPALNEATQLPALLATLGRQSGVRLDVVVVDGGSGDGTAEVAVAHGARIVHSAAGRGRQMNAGARTARADLLLFLHADSGLIEPAMLADAAAALNEAARARGDERVAGHFRLRFRRSRRGHALNYAFMEAKTGLNRRHTVNGDQGCLLTRGFFDALGGFDERLAFLEDQRLAERIRADGAWITLPGVLETSARRFEAEGLRKRYILMALIMGLHEVGLEEFFRRAPQVYAAQSDTGRLRLTPFLDLIARVLRRHSRRERRRIWHRVGGYVRENGWQLFLLADLAAGRLGLWDAERRPALGLYDRRLARRLANPMVDGVLAVLVRAWVMGVLRGGYRLTEWRRSS